MSVCVCMCLCTGTCLCVSLGGGCSDVRCLSMCKQIVSGEIELHGQMRQVEKICCVFNVLRCMSIIWILIPSYHVRSLYPLYPSQLPTAKECHLVSKGCSSRNVLKLKDEMILVCSNLCFIGLTKCCKSCWCSPPEHYAPFLTRNLIMLHVLRPIRSEHMPYCVLQGCHGLSLQRLLLS